MVLPIDQGEELFIAEGVKEAEHLLAIMRDLLIDDAPGVLALVTMRSDSYDRLQSAKALEGISQATLRLPPMPRGAYQEVIEGPLTRLRDTPRALTFVCTARIIRGGSWNSGPEYVRSAYRGADPAVDRRSNVGFRVGRARI